MGKIASKLKSTNNENDEQEIIKYEESLDYNGFGFQGKLRNPPLSHYIDKFGENIIYR
jgi:hypothetical protein